MTCQGRRVEGHDAVPSPASFSYSFMIGRGASNMGIYHSFGQ